MVQSEPKVGTRPCECKIGKVGSRFGVESLGTYARRQYVEEDESLRGTAREVNSRVVESVLNEADAEVIGTSEMIYTALVNDDADPETETRIRDQLAYKGVDVDALTEAFVSYATVKHHLNNCMGVDTSSMGTTDPGEYMDQVEHHTSRVESVVRRGIQRFERIGKLDIGTYEVTLTPRVRCQDCGRSYSPRELIRRGACECGGDGHGAEAVVEG